jgi:hypothetical protein
MPVSKMQKELATATKIKEAKYEDRQDFLEAMIDKANTLEDDVWEELSEPVQAWINAGIKAIKAKKKIKDFADVGAVPADEEDEEEAKPAKKAKKAVVEEDEEEDEKPAKKKAKKAAVEEDEE